MMNRNYISPNKQGSIKGNGPVGVGMLLVESEDDDAIVVDKLLPDGPAFRAGVQVGDVLLTVDGKSAEGKRTADLVNWIVGDEGTSVRMQLKRGGKTITVALTRGSAIGWDEVSNNKLRLSMLDSNITHKIQTPQPY
jgi:C-terminal processing protease CtpA/Prc